MKLRSFRHHCVSLSKSRKCAYGSCILIILIFCVLHGLLTPSNFNEFELNERKRLRDRGWRFFFHATTYYTGNRWQKLFNFSRCPYENRCTFVKDHSEADVLVFHMGDVFLQWWTHTPKKRQSQIWVLYGQEPPSTVLWNPEPLNGYFNWTLTHQRSSDIVVSYTSVGKWQKRTNPPQSIPDYWKGRKEGAFIVTSNCWTASKRMQYIEELSKYYPVYVYGACGNSCKTRADDCNFEKMALEYKFYLSFENSLCKDYISEKYFRNALSFYTVPVVRGGLKKEDYQRLSPPNSFIFADDFSSAKELGHYLNVVGKDRELYNKMLEWKHTYESITLKVEGPDCSLCAAVHNQTMLNLNRIQTDLKKVWNPQRDCRDSVVQPGRGISTRIRDYTLYLLNIN